MLSGDTAYHGVFLYFLLIYESSLYQPLKLVSYFLSGLPRITSYLLKHFWLVPAPILKTLSHVLYFCFSKTPSPELISIFIIYCYPKEFCGLKKQPFICLLLYISYQLRHWNCSALCGVSHSASCFCCLLTFWLGTGWFWMTRHLIVSFWNLSVTSPQFSYTRPSCRLSWASLVSLSLQEEKPQYINILKFFVNILWADPTG